LLARRAAWLVDAENLAAQPTGEGLKIRALAPLGGAAIGDEVRNRHVWDLL
jgi:hypothetical protein